MGKLADREKFAMRAAQVAIIAAIDKAILYMSDENVRRYYMIQERNKIARRCGAVLMKKGKKC